MKLIAFTAILLLAAFALASTPENAAEFCATTTGCTLPMLQISDEFSNGTLQIAVADPSAYSGSCFHLNSSLDAATEHHGAFAFIEQDNVLAATGVFSFFAKADPYAAMSNIELTEWLQKNYPPFKALHIEKTTTTLEFIDANSNISYWLRANSSLNKLLVIGRDVQAGSINYVFCRMNLHQ